MILNNPNFCLACFEKPRKGIRFNQKITIPLIKHHVNYFPEIIAYVHFECHIEIHEGKYPNLIQYKEGDSRRFYEI